MAKNVKPKVYCSNCKYFKEDGYDYSCYYVLGYEDTPKKKIEVYAEPYQANRDNHCPYYQSRKWFKLWL